jgi:carbon monoxide dehydrogenase subunit G
LCALVLFAALPARAAEVQRQARFTAEPAEVWAAIGDFCGIARWHPGVSLCVLEGDRRRLTLRDGSALVERQLERDDAAMRYSYTMEEGSLPVSDDYRATLLVTDRGDVTMVTWRAEFTPADGQSEAMATAVLARIFAAGLEGLGRLLRE